MQVVILNCNVFDLQINNPLLFYPTGIYNFISYEAKICNSTAKKILKHISYFNEYLWDVSVANKIASMKT